MTSLGFSFLCQQCTNQQRITGATTQEQTNDAAGPIKINMEHKIQKRTQSSNSKLKSSRANAQGKINPNSHQALSG